MGTLLLYRDMEMPKSINLFFPTWPSTIKRIKEEGVSKLPKEAFEVIDSDLGGVVNATAPGELPRNQKQMSNHKKRRTMALQEAKQMRFSL